MSSSSKMILREAAPDRTISQFPQAYTENYTPYKQLNFNTKVRSVCQQRSSSPRLGKVVLVGDIAVGKTSLVNRFCHNVFDRDYKATIGVDFEVEKFSILNTPFNLQVWDTAGAERFKCIAQSYYRGATAVITVFDMADLASLENARRWMTDACQNADGCLRFLVGSKTDLLSEQVFLEVELRAKEMANELNAEYWSLSSKTGERVNKFFFRLASLTFERCVLKEHERPETNREIGSLDITKDDEIYEKEQKFNCCN